MSTYGNPGQPPSFPDPNSPDVIIELGDRTEALWRRIQDIEQALSVQEWWLLARYIAEARLLSEISSLLAVASGELDNILSQYFMRAVHRFDQSDTMVTPDAVTSQQPESSAWRAASRDQSLGLLRMVATALPSMREYGRVLTIYAERYNLPPAILDSYGIVTSRLGEIHESLSQPPQ